MLFDIGEIHGRRYARVKRLGDVAFGLVGLLALLLATPFVLVGNLGAQPRNAALPAGAGRP